MPPHILDLPDEVLDKCLKELLPPIVPHDTYELSLFGPVDLKTLMTVCKTFQRLALPWVFRRVEFPFRRRWTFHNHPEVVPYVRFFALHIGPLTTPEDLAPICAIVPFMTNLRVLRFSAEVWRDWDLIDKLYFTLVSKPHLHTLTVTGYITANTEGLPSLIGLKRLRMEVHNKNEYLLLERTQYLESLAISCPSVEPDEDIPIPWTTMSIPWATLREVAMYDYDVDYHFKPLDDWYLISKNYSLWKNSFPDTSSRLTELFIYFSQSSITLEHIQLLAVFGPQLRRLCLAYFLEIDQELLDHIVVGFPHLHELRLFSRTEDMGTTTVWTVEPSSIAESFGKLSMLKRLTLNYSDGTRYLEKNSEKWRLNVVRVIARRCQSLELLVFDEDFPGDMSYFGWTSFTILRNDNGEYEKCLQTKGDQCDRPLTSGWDLWNYSCI